ncbi:ATP-NAD kinase [Polychaeton citri CBS 116435]|uniref:ATP-NAD kinase n=1 Tax=Polychaeton citri CBS 116435 TaxID=1314669 RepID=A0A9P4Q743_9PEZI|nr:ATP-NAD kinase [Polychaeton citri CBS 116435]
MKAIWQASTSRSALLLRSQHRLVCVNTRQFSASIRRQEIRSIDELPDRTQPQFIETPSHSLLSLHWLHPLRNILFVLKEEDPTITAAALELANHLHQTYPAISLVFEPKVARRLHSTLPFPIYSLAVGERDQESQDHTRYAHKVDLTTTLGGDGTILHAASLFARSRSVPPVLSFSMGTLGFLGEWNFAEYKRAFREVFVSGAPEPFQPASTEDGEQHVYTSREESWRASLPRGHSMGAHRNSRILLRNRLRIGLHDTATGAPLPPNPTSKFSLQTSQTQQEVFALNEVLLHRGALPHLAHITILLGPPSFEQQKPLTTAIADGFLVSSPTGSTAYSLSSGGSIVHPLLSSLLLTPICPRSLSFRPVVLPANTGITLRIDEENRGKEIEVSVDGIRRGGSGLRAGMEVRVVGEDVRMRVGEGGNEKSEWGGGGVPCVVRSGGGGGEEHWVGGLNSLLKFNYPFGEEK